MRKSIWGVVAIACTILPAAAFSQEDFLGQLFAKANEIYVEKGFTATGMEHRGSLSQGAEERLDVTFDNGSQFQLIGVCDGNCADFNIQLLDANGKEIDRDDQEDDFPIVGTATAGSYTARITMAKCTGGPCDYGIKAFRK